MFKTRRMFIEKKKRKRENVIENENYLYGYNILHLPTDKKLKEYQKCLQSTIEHVFTSTKKYSMKINTFNHSNSK